MIESEQTVDIKSQAEREIANNLRAGAAVSGKLAETTWNRLARKGNPETGEEEGPLRRVAKGNASKGRWSQVRYVVVNRILNILGI